MYNLSGKMLIAMPHMEDIRFRGGIVYIYQHNGEGTLGLMLNKVIEKPIFSLIIQKENIENLTDVNVPVVLGGPVETNKGFVLHTSDYMDSDTHVIDARYCITSGTDIIKAIVNGVGPRKFTITLGYSGWGVGQLEDEMLGEWPRAEHNGWFTVDADETFMFGDENDLKWKKAIDKYTHEYVNNLLVKI